MPDDWQRILNISKRLKNNESPDTVVYAALAEIICAKYLAFREFINLKFNKNSVDITATFLAAVWNIEATFISGEDFKFLEAQKLIDKLNLKYQEKESQIKRHFNTTDNSVIVIVMHGLETYEPYMAHVREDGKHPIQAFIENCQIPTVVLGSGTIYEPDAPFVVGSFPINEF